MTLSAIKDLTGCSEKTIRTKTKELFPGKVKNGVKTDLNIDESELLIMELKKKGIVEKSGKSAEHLGKSAEHLGKNTEVSSGLTEKDITLISSIVSMTVAKTIEALDNRVQKIETAVKERKAILPPPDIPKRKQLNQIINNYCAKSGLTYQEAYNRLYNDVYYRLGVNLKLQASNRGCKAIDIAEELGRLDDLIAIASTF